MLIRLKGGFALDFFSTKAGFCLHSSSYQPIELYISICKPANTFKQSEGFLLFYNRRYTLRQKALHNTLYQQLSKFTIPRSISHIHLIILLIFLPFLQRKRLSLPQLQAEARLKMNIQPAKTVAITVLAFLACYIPTILFLVWGRHRSDESWWSGFIAHFSIFASSGINPIIYCFRTRRFRSTLKQLIKDPCGRSLFKRTIKCKWPSGIFHVRSQDRLQQITESLMSLKRAVWEPEPTLLGTKGNVDSGYKTAKKRKAIEITANQAAQFHHTN